MPTARPRTATTVIDVESVIREGGGLVDTATLFYRSELLQSIPRFRAFFSLDYTSQIHGALRGGLLYLDEVMSVYRYRSKGAWSTRTFNDAAKKAAHHQKLIEMLRLLDEDTNGQYHDTIATRTAHLAFELDILLHSYRV